MYPQSSGSNIGALLRMIQEDQNKSLPAQNPALDPNSPIRGVIQGGVNAPESPGSSRQISVRPEGAIQQGPQAASVVGPVAPPVVSSSVAPVQGPTSPVARSSGVSAPTPSLSSLSPALGTRISSAPKGIASSSVLGSSARPAGQVASKPSVAKNQPSTSKVSGSQGAFGGGVKTAAAEAFLPKLAQALAGSTLAKIFTPLSFVNPQLISPKGSFSQTGKKVY